MNRPSWDEYFMQMAELTAKRSTCLRRNVGAIIVKDKHIIATGYNGAPKGLPHCEELGGCLRQKLGVPSGERHELCRALHAEQNAIIQAGQDRCKGATMYIWGHNFICILCKRFIVQSGIEKIYLQKDENSPIEFVDANTIREELSKSILSEKDCAACTND